MSNPKYRENQYDLILIGSGMGALTVASLMAQMRDKKVLVLERHFKAGGFTHEFKRQKFHWDVGIHYVGMMGEGNQERNIFDFVTGGGVQWVRMPDEPMDVVVYPELRFAIAGNKERFMADLIERFPQEKSAVRQYFRDLKMTYNMGYVAHVQKQCRAFPLPLLGAVQGLFAASRVNLTTQEYLDHHFKHPELKAILTAQWGCYGLPPNLSAFAVHAVIINHYLDGAYYPAGGAGTIITSTQPIIKDKGGKFLLNREVTQVLIENSRAVGVQVRKVNEKDDVFEEYYAPVIVSDAGATTTYLKLIPPEYPIPFRESLRQFVEQNEPTTNLTLYLGLSEDPRKLGFQGENHWIYASLNYDEIYSQRSEWIKNAKPLQAYLSFPSLKDPQATAHTAEILVWADYNVFAQWHDQPWLHRDEEYQALKERLTDGIIDFVNQYYPGFADIVEYKELSTPVTNEHFTGHHHGAIYGLPFVPKRFCQENLDWTRPTTPLPGLYLTGADVFCPGIVGALMGGVFTVGELPSGIPNPEIVAAATKVKKAHLVNS